MTRGHGWLLTTTLWETCTPYPLPTFTGAFDFHLLLFAGFHLRFLNVPLPIVIPPLRDRRADIPQLAEQFLDGLRKHQGKPLPGLSQAALDSLLAYDWPGNVRELRNLLEYASIITSGDLIQPEHLRLQPQLPSLPEEQAKGRVSLKFSFAAAEFSLDAVNRQVMEWALAQCNNNKSSASRLLKASRKLFY